MSDRPRTAAMQGGGFYNRNSQLQAANLTSALPLLEDAARNVPLGRTGPVVLADYGASQGRNSMQPIAAAIDTLRPRIGNDRPVEVVHVDLPSNDFASLFTLIDEDAASYLAGREHVYPLAIGRSHFAPVLPPESVHLGWSSNAIHWLSRNPVLVRDHGWASFSASADARAAVDRQLNEDWENFLRARASELAPGGRIICQFLSRGPESHGFEWMAGSFWQSIEDVARDGMISEDELTRMTAPSAGRSREQLEAPFAGGDCYGLKLLDLAIRRAPDPFWDRYQETGDAEALGRTWANLMRAANGPSFVAGLDDGRDADAIFDAVCDRLAARIAAGPRRSESYNVMLVLEKPE